MPVSPTPLPSSRTVLQPQTRGGDANLCLSERKEWSANPPSRGRPVCEDLLVIQSPLCQVKSRLPGHKASGPNWYQCNIFQQANSITAGLQNKSSSFISGLIGVTLNNWWDSLHLCNSVTYIHRVVPQRNVCSSGPFKYAESKSISTSK